MKKRIRAVGIIFLNGGILLMHRKNVKYKKPNEYYVLPGVTCNNEDEIREKLQEEILKEIALKVKVKNLVFHLETNQTNEYFYFCEYISGKLGSIKSIEESKVIYRYSGNYIPEIVRREELINLYLIPEGVKEKLLEETSWNSL